MQNELFDSANPAQVAPTGAAEARYTVTEEATGQIIGTVPADQIDKVKEEARANRDPAAASEVATTGQPLTDEQFFVRYKTLSPDSKLAISNAIETLKAIRNGAAVDVEAIRANHPPMVAQTLIEHLTGSASQEGGTDNAKPQHRL